ncbi:efflux RND transporter permease subunit [Alloacidobacterium dinghuense]|uniref:Efflux RND transporter permease subunit n=1 Tax=Alloacidobacterium dinghuense TaxID=2763107 RepID=A0A7G8BMU1_9BACT|nr:efflux RND transporter permease subunit [Alloacidobacterium dinghuense]QNI33861.1 efflux RND transporter permease subunit [Alloacidobacterium dinghuense]
MPKFALRYPYFIIMVCMVIVVVGITNIFGMPVDLFPKIDIPVVVVATFYSGMPPQQIEADITDTFERFFTLGSNIDHIESRSLTGVSLIKIYFKPGTDPNAALSNIANLAMADLRRLPPGTLPPVVLGMDASSQPVCLVTLKGKGLNETSLKDLAQFQVRNQIANVPGASVPQPFGGRYRQIMVYVDPVKLQAYNMSLMDVVHAVNESNLILPAGDVRIGTKDYNIYANSQVPTPDEINDLPLKSLGNASVLVANVGKAEDAGTIQTNIVRIDGQRSVYIPILKQGGGSNTITIVDGMKHAIRGLVDIPSSLRTAVVFDQSIFVKGAIRNLIKEASIGLVLTGVMILVFLGSPRATFAVLLSIPLSALVCLLIMNAMGGSINTMLLGGLALAFSRLIDDSVVVLENIFRYMEMGEAPPLAAEKGGMEVSLAVLAATSTTSIVFFPVTFFAGVSKYIFTDLALGVVLSIFASYIFAMTVVPLYCSKFIHLSHVHEGNRPPSLFRRSEAKFNEYFHRMLDYYEVQVTRAMKRPGRTAAIILGGVAAVLFGLFPILGRAYFPRTDPGQFVINIKCPSGTRIELSNQYIAEVENEIRQVIPGHDLGMIVSNIGITPDLSAIYTSNSAMDTAFVQVSLNEDHKTGSYAYMGRVRRRLAADIPQLTTYFQAGGLVDSVINQGLPAPIDIQVSGNDLDQSFGIALDIAKKVKNLKNVSDVLIPQDLRYPGLELNIDRERANLINISPQEVVDNVITAMTSNGMIAPSYWIDPKTGNNYMLTVQYFDQKIANMSLDDFKQIPLRASDVTAYTPLQSVANIKEINTPTEVDHYQIRRVIDVYVMPSTETLVGVSHGVNKIINSVNIPKNVRIKVRGAAVNMNESFTRFAIGLLLSIALVYLILMAQFTSFIDPFIILMAIPPGLAGVVLILLMTHSTLNIMSLMGVIMMTGIVVSNSILIVEFATILHKQGKPLLEAVVQSCKIRLRPILMTSLATLLGMIPMALGFEAGSEQYAPLARAIIGGLGVSVVVTVFLVPAVYLLIHGRREEKGAPAEA